MILTIEMGMFMKNHICVTVALLLFFLNPKAIGAERVEIKVRASEHQKAQELFENDKRLACALSFFKKIPKRDEREQEIAPPIQGIIKEYLAELFLSRWVTLGNTIDCLSAYGDNGLK